MLMNLIFTCFRLSAYPTILTDLGNIDIPVHETLTVTCSFTSKPVSTVTWTGPSGSPNDVVLDITTTTQSNTPYTITTSRMMWKTDDYDLRKTVSGDYTCIANNGYHDVTSKTMNLNVQCTYYDILMLDLKILCTLYC